MVISEVVLVVLVLGLYAGLFNWPSSVGPWRECLMQNVVKILCVSCTILLGVLSSREVLADPAPLAQWGGTLTNEALNIPVSTERFTAVAAGGAHNLGLRADGSLVQWGDNEVAQRNGVPIVSERFSKVAAGLTHSLGLRLDGSLVQWGDSSLGQSGGAPGAAERFVAISVGAYHSVALRADGSLIQWGGTLNGQRLSAPANTERFTAIACGAFHTIALRTDGSLVQWGATNGGQTANAPASAERFIKIAAGRQHSLALRADGSLVQWGNTQIQQGLNAPASSERFSSITAGYYHSVALRLDGSLIQWGALGDDQRLNGPGPTDRFTFVSAGTFQTVALRAPSATLEPAGSTTFLYQGRLQGGPGPVNIRFSLFDDANAGTRLGEIRTAVNVVMDDNGLFSVPVNFGSLSFAGERFIQIEVAPVGSTTYELLRPRQRLTATPKATNASIADSAGTALTASTAQIAGSVPWAGVTGVPSNVVLAPWSNSTSGPLNSISYMGGNVGIGTTTPSQRLTVSGNVLANNISSPSSARFKENVVALSGCLDGVMAMEAVRFDWKAEQAKPRGFTRDFGFIAEDVAKLFPEIVFFDEDGKVAGMDYARLSAVAIGAVKELTGVVRTQGVEIERLNAEIRQHAANAEAMRARLEAIESALSGGHVGVLEGAAGK